MKFILQVAFLLCCVVTFQCEGAFVNPNIVTRGGGWGLLEVPFNNTNIDNFIIKSGYYGLQQFSQHIKQGYQIVFSSDEMSVAAISRPDEKLVIVTVNPSNTTEVTKEFDLSLFNLTLGSVSLFRTSPTEQHVNLPPPSISSEIKKATIQLPALSVSTLVFSVQFSAKANLIENGGFESVLIENRKPYPTGWQVAGGGNAGHVTQANVWAGRYSGYLDYWSNGGSRISQSFTIMSNSPCQLYLSAWCLSTGQSTKLGVTVNNVQGPERTMPASEGPYAFYSFYFSANPFDIVQVYFMNIGAVSYNGQARIDNVVVESVCG